MGSLLSKTSDTHQREDGKELQWWLKSHLLYERSCSRPCLFLFCCVSFPKGGWKKPHEQVQGSVWLSTGRKERNCDYKSLACFNTSSHAHTQLMTNIQPVPTNQQEHIWTDDPFSYTPFTCFYLYTHTHTTPPAFSLCKQTWLFQIVVSERLVV